jgi:hypothetical protein
MSLRVLVTLFLLFILPTVQRVAAQVPSVYTVLFTHIEDNTPVGTLGTPQSRQNYMLYRGRLIEMANLARSYTMPWVLQPDWKFLLAALLYEDSTVIPSTNNKNLLRYLKEDLGAVIDPHSHENGGYNYTDVAHLLDSLGVGATTVIGGHIWDPTLPQFQQWDRFRVPVRGQRYPWALWRGDILMGSGTPNHVNDPIVSGVWRPRDRYHYFEHDSLANITAIGQFRGTLESARELNQLYRNGTVPPTMMLTLSHHIRPAMITRAGGITAVEDSVMRPARALRDSGIAHFTDFSSLVATWRTQFNARGFLYTGTPTAVSEHGNGTPNEFALRQNYPNPCNPTTRIRFGIQASAFVSLRVFDVLGKEVAMPVNAFMTAGEYEAEFDAKNLTSGVYCYQLRAGNFVQTKMMVVLK